MCKEPHGRPSGRDRKCQSGSWSGRGRAATVGGTRRPGPAGFLGGGRPDPGLGGQGRGGRGGRGPPTPPPPRRRRCCRRAPEAGGDFLCPPRPRPPGRRLRPSLASRPPAPTKPRAEGRGRRRPGGRHGPQAKRTGVSGAGPLRVAAGGRDARLPGAAGGGPVTHGAGGGSTRPPGRCLNRGSAPLTFCARPSPWLPGPRRRCQGPRLPAAVTRAQVTPWLLSLDLLLPPFTGNLFSDLTSPAPALPLSDSLKFDPLQGHCDKKKGSGNLTPERAPVPPMPHPGQRAGFPDGARLAPVPLGCSFCYTLLSCRTAPAAKTSFSRCPDTPICGEKWEMEALEPRLQ